MATSARHPVDKLPRLPNEGIPSVKEADALMRINDGCILMMQVTRQFASAIMLFDYCMDGINREKQGEPRSELPLAEWRRMAGRDAGMSVYHFGMTIEVVRQFVGKSDWLSSKIDTRELREIKNQMNASFPGWDDVRQAIAHRADLFIDPAKSPRHRVTVTPGHTQTYWNRLQGRTFTHTFNGKRLACELSEQSLERLVEIRRKFFAALNQP